MSFPDCSVLHVIMRLEMQRVGHEHFTVSPEGAVCNEHL